MLVEGAVVIDKAYLFGDSREALNREWLVVSHLKKKIRLSKAI